MSSRSASDSEDNAEFGRLLDITSADLVALASRIRKTVFKADTSSGCLVQTSNGSFNLVHILQLDDLKMVIRIPITGQSGDLHSSAKEALESQVQTIDYIRKHTSIPVPQIYHFDTTANNEIRAPYIAMSHVSGRNVSHLWFDTSGPTPLEDRRQRILTQLAKIMSQLRTLHFDKIGSLLPNSQSGGIELGPCYEWDTAEDEAISITSSGPFSTTQSFLRSFWAPVNDKNEFAIGAARILEEMLPYIPSTSEFVLAPPDFDSQNVMVDEQGNITGLIDWDNVQTVPSFIGCLRYPGWITRDWDPLMYGWPHLEDRENSPEDLQKYRAYYLDEMKKALEPTGNSDYNITGKSHIFEAFWIAVSNGANRTEICRKIVEEATRALEAEDLPDNLDQDSLSILYRIANDDLDDEDWAELRRGLLILMSQGE